MKAGIRILSGTMVCGIMVVLNITQAVAAADTLEEALTGGKVTLNVRYRYEHVDQNNVLKNADASTIRSRLGYETDSFYGVSAYLELQNITSVGRQYYNSGANGKTDYSVVSDPTVSQTDQAYLAWEAPTDTLIKFGRQVINLDNQRFVGRVDWRQNGQTFDALSLVNKSLPDTAVTFAYMSNADRITATSARMSSKVLNARYSGLAAGVISGYAYLLDFDKIPSLSAQTYGLRFSGASSVSIDKKVIYAAEFAKQSDYANNPGKYDLNYLLAELGGMWGEVSAKLGYEALEGDGINSVQTPLATLHAFNGWADQFLTTPAAGLEDSYLSVGGAAADVKLLAFYHDFKANKGGADYGKEWDVQAVKKFGKLYSLAAKYASYDAGTAAGKVDTRKLWLIGQLAL